MSRADVNIRTTPTNITRRSVAASLGLVPLVAGPAVAQCVLPPDDPDVELELLGRMLAHASVHRREAQRAYNAVNAPIEQRARIEAGLPGSRDVDIEAPYAILSQEERLTRTERYLALLEKYAGADPEHARLSRELDDAYARCEALHPRIEAIQAKGLRGLWAKAIAAWDANADMWENLGDVGMRSAS